MSLPHAGGPLSNAPTDRALTDPVSVDCICPTFNRPNHHGALYRSFAEQDHEPRNLWVLDNSPQPSPFFKTLFDPRVHYVHQPGRTPHGAARNELLHMSSGQVVAHFDDDDRYASSYLTKQILRLRDSDADLVKLAAWDEVFPDGRRSRLDGRRLHENDLWGWGFSYVYRRHVTSRVSFQSVDGTGPNSEDIVFMRGLQAAGFKTQLVDDAADSVLHLQRYGCYFFNRAALVGNMPFDSLTGRGGRAAGRELRRQRRARPRCVAVVTVGVTWPATGPVIPLPVPHCSSPSQ